MEIILQRRVRTSTSCDELLMIAIVSNAYISYGKVICLGKASEDYFALLVSCAPGILIIKFSNV
jgi:hypothetical protein